MQNQDRQDSIHNKGFDMIKAPDSATSSYSKIKFGKKTYDDATIDLRYYEKLDLRCFKNKGFVMEALINLLIILQQCIDTIGIWFQK